MAAERNAECSAGHANHHQGDIATHSIAQPYMVIAWSDPT